MSTTRILAVAATGVVLLAGCGSDVDGWLEVAPQAPGQRASPAANATASPAGHHQTSEEPDVDESLVPTRDGAESPTPSPTSPTSSPSTGTPNGSATDGGSQPVDGSGVLVPGDRGEQVAQVQRQLIELGYWLGDPDGVFGDLTEQAVFAFQGWEGLTRDGKVGPETRQALRQAHRPVPDGDGDGIEIHRSEQVLLVVRDGRTRWAIHTSTGTGERYQHPSGHTAVADTPAGTWSISWQVDGWRSSDLGRLWRPKYFHPDGLAIHGYHEVPAFPASHGCARVSIPAMNLIWSDGLAPEGTGVTVF